MHILSIDHGSRRIGLAKWHSDANVVLPFGVVAVVDEKTTLEKLLFFINNEKFDKIIIGFPLGLDGKENEHTQKIKNFVQKLSERTNVPIEFVDEKFSSQQADRNSGGVSRDEKAAMVILQSFLDKPATK